MMLLVYMCDDVHPLQCSYLENPRDGGAWWAAVYGVAQSRTRLKRLNSSISSSIHIQVICIYENVYIQVKIGNWKICVGFLIVNMFNKVKLYSNFFYSTNEWIPSNIFFSEPEVKYGGTDRQRWTKRGPSLKMKTSTETHNSNIVDVLWKGCWVAKIPWRTKWQSVPVFLPGKSHGQKSLVGYSPWGHKESDTTEQLNLCVHTHTHAQMHDQSTESRKLALCEDVRQGFTEIWG